MKLKLILVLILPVLLSTWSGEQVLAEEVNFETAELEAFMDGVIGGQINEHRIPGAVVSVVSDGEMVFSRGYGFSDLEGDMPVVPETTLFRPGSVSKLVTWTAVMQLAERGELDLDEDINSYLDFTIPGDEPITMRNIMTHTPGFEDVGEGLFVLAEDEMTSLEDYLRTYLPARVFPAGEIMAYSNYATGLAGYVVEKITGQDFADYVDEHIFQPLDMERSTFRQPLPDHMADDLAGAYKYSGGKYHRGEFEYMSNNAAGALSTTAEDMAAFMLAHLELGGFQDERILQEETASEMHGYHFTHHQDIEGMALGFARQNINGEEIIAHTGATTLFFSGMYLLPEHDTGLFVSYSGGTGLEMTRLFQSFMDRYFPEPEGPVTERPVSNESRTRTEALVGEYHSTRSSFTGEEKLLGIIQRTSVDINEEGYLMLSFRGDGYRMQEVEPGLYENIYSHGSMLVDRVAFIDNPEDRTLLATGGPGVYQRVEWYESTLLLIGLTGLMLLLSAGTIINRIRRFLVRKFLGEYMVEGAGKGEARVASLIMVLTSITVIVFVVGMIGVFTSIDPAYGVPDIMFNIISTPAYMLFYLPYLIAGLIAAAIIFALQSWWKKYWSLYRRISYSIYALTGAGFVWVLYYMNLLQL